MEGREDLEGGRGDANGEQPGASHDVDVENSSAMDNSCLVHTVSSFLWHHVQADLHHFQYCVPIKRRSTKAMLRIQFNDSLHIPNANGLIGLLTGFRSCQYDWLTACSLFGYPPQLSDGA